VISGKDLEVTAFYQIADILLVARDRYFRRKFRIVTNTSASAAAHRPDATTRAPRSREDLVVAAASGAGRALSKRSPSGRTTTGPASGPAWLRSKGCPTAAPRESLPPSAARPGRRKRFGNLATHRVQRFDHVATRNTASCETSWYTSALSESVVGTTSRSAPRNAIAQSVGDGRRLPATHQVFGVHRARQAIVFFLRRPKRRDVLDVSSRSRTPRHRPSGVPVAEVEEPPVVEDREIHDRALSHSEASMLPPKRPARGRRSSCPFRATAHPRASAAGNRDLLHRAARRSTVPVSARVDARRTSAGNMSLSMAVPPSGRALRTAPPGGTPCRGGPALRISTTSGIPGSALDGDRPTSPGLSLPPSRTTLPTGSRFPARPRLHRQHRCRTRSRMAHRGLEVVRLGLAPRRRA